jgi:hypothetical protein
VRSTGVPSEERIKVFRLAWDIIGSELLPNLAGFVFAERFTGELYDPVLDRGVKCDYSVQRPRTSFTRSSADRG